MGEHTPESLMQWAADCNRRNNGGVGMHLVEYAKAWERERDALRAELDAAYDELRKQWPVVKAVLDPAVWQRAKNAQPRGTQERAEWITHDSDHAPADLAPAQFVEYGRWTWGEGEVYLTECADNVPWHPGLRYRLAISADGLPLCSADGLGARTTHVATDGDDSAWAYFEHPHLRPTGRWVAESSHGLRAPSTHRKPGPESESLMEVWRD